MEIKRLQSKILTILLLIPCYLLLVTSVEAHVLKTDGEIGAVFHTDPDDDPIANQQTGLFFDFKDKENRFSLAICDCNIIISENGKEIFSQKLQPDLSDNLSANFFFKFPEKNVYQIKVTGKPNAQTDFQPFSLSYDIRVDKEADSSNQTSPNNTNWFSTHIIHLIGGIIVGLFLIFALIKQKSQTK
ncbi:hypothetical protein HY025_03125 [Candidatus Daviesbacteria bacterium]|nr:hypothetical protein [Candidatus Daviesbacteria bacterium]